MTHASSSLETGIGGCDFRSLTLRVEQTGSRQLNHARLGESSYTARARLSQVTTISLYQDAVANFHNFPIIFLFGDELQMPRVRLINIVCRSILKNHMQ